MKNKLRWQLIVLGVFALIVGVLAYPKEGQLLQWVGIDSDLSVSRGLDLQGGVYLVYEADIPKDQNSEEALKRVKTVIQQRIDPGGASEAVIQIAENDRVIVQLPDVEDPQAAIDLIGQTASLEFFEVDPEAETQDEQLIPTELSGDDVARADAAFGQTTNQPVVNLRLESGESREKFANLTTRIYNSNTQLLILLDGKPVFGPATVSEPLLAGQARLTGQQSIEEAQEIAGLIEAGALPVPIELVAQETIGPTLGEEATSASVVAGAIGLLSLVVFLIAVYRMGGVVAVVAMAIYTATTITIFKVSALQIFGGYTIVLTLAGIAGFIMSIAVAADANILVLERLREERKAGMKPFKAVETGFDHAWTSIRDASIATLILCGVLYYLASRLGEPSIQGFALVLGLGVAVNVASVTFVTKTLLRGIVRTKIGDKI